MCHGLASAETMRHLIEPDIQAASAGQTIQGCLDSVLSLHIYSFKEPDKFQNLSVKALSSISLESGPLDKVDKTQHRDVLVLALVQFKKRLAWCKGAGTVRPWTRNRVGA